MYAKKKNAIFLLTIPRCQSAAVSESCTGKKILTIDTRTNNDISKNS